MILRYGILQLVQACLSSLQRGKHTAVRPQR